MNGNTMGKNRSVTMFRYAIGIAVIAFALTQTCSLKAASEVPSKKGAEDKKPKRLSSEEISEIWKKIRTAEAPKSLDVKEGSAEYWGPIMDVGFKELKKIVDSSNPREGLEYFVKQFGKDGAQTDMRWLMAARSRLLPANTELRPHRQDPKEHKLLRAELIFAELQVRQFLKNPKMLERYYQSVIWFDFMFSDLFFPVRLGVVYRNMKEGSPDDDYWWYAQNFVLMAHATGRDDLLKGVKPEDLKSRFQQWYRWFMQNGMYLRASPDAFYWALEEKEKKVRKVYFPFLAKQRLPPLKVLPIYPFPDWKGPKPTTPKNYRDME